MLQILCIIYAVGLLVGMLLLVLASRAEPTRRGRAFIWSYGLVTVLGWPVAIGWSLVAGAVLGGSWAIGRLRGR